MVTYTTTYNLKKPTVADDEDVWGGYLNDSMDIIDDVLDGTVPVTGIDINSGTLDNVVIGGTTANSGTFTVLSATTSLDVVGNITVSGTVDGVDVASFKSAYDTHNHDGRYYTESEVNTFINRSYVSSHGASDLATGWYTIAQNRGDRAVARFALWDTDSGDHQAVIFYASHHFGTDASNTLTVLDNSHYSGNPFRYIRIKDGGTYDGAALQVYIDDASNFVHVAIVGDDVQTSGWDIVDFLPDATAPSQVSNWANFGERSKIDLDQIAQGGLATTGPIYADGDTTQYRVFNDNYHPNADKWTTARTHTVTLTGDVTGSASQSVDGTGNKTWTISTAVGNNSHEHTRLQERSTITYGAGQLQWTDLNGIGGTGLNTATPTNPTEDWYHHILMNHANSNGYYVDLAACFHHDGFYMRRLTNGALGSWNRFFADNYHPNADKWTTARTLSLSGDASGSVSWDGSANATLNVTVADDSHNHVISNVDGLQTALDAKLASSSYTASDVLTKIKTVDGSGSGLDADTLDGIQASSFLRSDTADTMTGNLTLTGTVDHTGVYNGIYHGIVEDRYYFDDYIGAKNINAFLETQRSDIIRYQPVSNLEYWDGSSWQDGSSQLSNLKNLLDGRKDTMWYVPSTYYKFRFTVTANTSWPTRALIGLETAWTGSTFQGCQMLVEELQTDSSWDTKVTADFNSSNGVTNWGTMFRADSALHTGRGSQANATRITIDFSSWTPSNPSYVTVPLQNIFVLSNFTGTENNDYKSLLNYDRDIAAPANITVSGRIESDDYRSATNQQIQIQAGESFVYSTGQTGEYVYLNGDNGVQINCSPDNWASGWAGRDTYTFSSSGLQFPDGTTQTTAATAAEQDYGLITGAVTASNDYGALT